MSLEERLSAASRFLVQSPPGEINDVFTDLLALVGDDSALEHAILPALRQYNLDQYVVAPAPARDERPGPRGAKVVVTPDSPLEAEPDARDDRHVDWRNRQTFAFDHMKAATSDAQEISRQDLYDDATLEILDAVDKVFDKHVQNHYHDAVSALYPLEDERYPAPPPPPAASRVPVVPQEPEQEVEPAQREEEGASLAQGLPESAQESADVAAETAEVAEQMTSDETAAEAEGDSVPMDVGTPAAAQPEAEAQPEPAAEAEAEVEVERPLKTSRLFALYLVGNKYNPNNYWTGRWRSKYVLDYETGQLDGTAQVNIHYYEQGNVQLATTLYSSERLDASPSPEQVVASIKQSEQTFATSLSSTYSELSDETFKGLRRALPKTRSKIDWNKAGGYRLGHELGGGQAP
ncbi:hypothetical protein JCM11491_001078 [Sporobolomyces phaffii]